MLLPTIWCVLGENTDTMYELQDQQRNRYAVSIQYTWAEKVPLACHRGASSYPPTTEAIQKQSPVFQSKMLPETALWSPGCLPVTHLLVFMA